MGKFDAIRKYYKKDDNVKVMSSLGACYGVIDELGEDYIVLKTKYGKITTLDAADIISVTKFTKSADSKTTGARKNGNDSKAELLTKARVVESNPQKTKEKKVINIDIENEIADINKKLTNENSPNIKSSLLLKKGELYSSLCRYKEALKAYNDLIKVSEELLVSDARLSQFYAVYAGLIIKTGGKQDDAQKYAKLALDLNPDNPSAQSILKTMGVSYKTSTPRGTSSSINNQELIIDKEDSDDKIISPMIDFDVNQCQFTNEDILRNNGNPTMQIADTMYEKAKETKDVDISERYPLYLETAKAYKELGVKSDYEKYWVSVAFYAMLKGNSLYLKFRNLVNNGNRQTKELTRLKDSACNYYMESLNLLSNINTNFLLTILRNYFILNIAIYNMENSENIEFGGQFKNLFLNCINSEHKRKNEIAYKAIISIGASSIKVWNNLATMKNGTGILYDSFFKRDKREKSFQLINEIECAKVDIELKPKDFLKYIFENRKDRISEFKKFIKEDLQTQKLDLWSIDSLINIWNKINTYINLLYPTDIEIKNEVDKILSLLKPYIIRQTEKERTNLLYKAQSSIENLLNFIDENVTYYGRVLFAPLLKQWLSDIKLLFDTKIAQTLPKLVVITDPNYIFVDNSNNNDFVSIIIKNDGESTADGYMLNVEFVDPYTNETFIVEPIREENKELSVGDQFEKMVTIPIVDKAVLTVIFNVTAVYQQQELDTLKYEYTIEREPKSSLTYQDVKWQEGQIPEEQLFKGRQDLIDRLKRHYMSIERDKAYILYGLTRVGKSSILSYLEKDIDRAKITIDNDVLSIATFELDFSTAANFNAEDFWHYLIGEQIYKNLKKYLSPDTIATYSLPSKPRAKDLPIILHFLKEHNLYPLFFFDEFSFIKDMIDKKTISSAFLQTLRQYSFDGLASFIYAGTYDIKMLIRNPEYGMTGQLVNTREEQIDKIKKSYADELINVIDSKLSFTNAAREHIHRLSGDIPYFIQIICKNCGFYAVENKRRYIGYPELEEVIKILTGEKNVSSMDSFVKELPENCFQNNQYSPADSKSVNVLISSIAYYNKDVVNNPRGISLPELHRLWSERGISDYRPRLAESIKVLLEKRVLIDNKDGDIIVYKLSVDLFRRWWSVHHQDIDLEITALQ